MASITPPTPILEPSADILVAYLQFKAAKEQVERTFAGDGIDSKEYAAAVVWADQAQRELEAAIPVRAGWYRLDDRVWGWAKVSKGGFELASKAAAWSLDHPEGRRYRERQARELVRTA